jgi:putative transposase
MSDARRLTAREAGNAWLTKLLAETTLENEVTKEALRKTMVTGPAKRKLVPWMMTRGVSEQRCLEPVGMSARALRYESQVIRTDKDLRGSLTRC